MLRKDSNYKLYTLKNVSEYNIIELFLFFLLYNERITNNNYNFFY